MKKEFCLIYGGRSGEHEVSLRSAASIYKNINKELFNIMLIGIAKDGLWYLQENPQSPGEFLNIECDSSKIVGILPMKGFLINGKIVKTDVVFPIIHGTFGEDGTLQGLLEMSGFPYVGATVGGSYLAMDKDVCKALWQCKGIKVVPYMTLRKQEMIDSKEANICKQIEHKYSYPLFIKPSSAGSSVGVSKVEKKEQLISAIKKAFSYDTKIIIEPAIVGREVECSVIGNNKTESYPPGEVAPTHEFYDYNAKYLDPHGAGLIIPAKIDDSKAKELKEIAQLAYGALDLRGFARVDFFIEEKTGDIILNEVNTLPGFTDISMFSMMCHEGGLKYPEMLEKLIDLGLDQFSEKNSINYNFET